MTNKLKTALFVDILAHLSSIIIFLFVVTSGEYLSDNYFVFVISHDLTWNHA